MHYYIEKHDMEMVLDGLEMLHEYLNTEPPKNPPGSKKWNIQHFRWRSIHTRRT